MEPTNKKSIVAQVDLKRSATNAYGPVHYFSIAFENGDKGDYGASQNPQNKFVVGQEADYTLTCKVNGDFTNYYIKPLAKNGYNGGVKLENVRAANAREALHSATILITSGLYPPDQLGPVRDKFNDWLNEQSR